jgi:hypothetical protein
VARSTTASSPAAVAAAAALTLLDATIGERKEREKMREKIHALERRIAEVLAYYGQQFPGSPASLRSRRRFAGKAWVARRGEFRLVFGVKLVANGSDLTKLKFGEPETAPAFSSADQRAERQSPFAESHAPRQFPSKFRTSPCAIREVRF